MNDSYLGDGVYASFDGYHVLLCLDRHDNPDKIALEPAVLRALVEYAERLKRPADSATPSQG